MDVVSVGELFDYSLYLVAFSWKSECGQELSQSFIDGHILEVKRLNIQFEDLLVELVRVGQILAHGEFA